MKELGVWNEELETLTKKMGNQAIISGTADYSFKHFAKYWERYKGIIDSKGDPEKLKSIFGEFHPTVLTGGIIVLYEFHMNLSPKDLWMINKFLEQRLLFILVSTIWNMLLVL